MDENATPVSPLQNHQLKRPRIDQDPDYNEAAPPDVKKLKCLEDNGMLIFKQVFFF